MPDVFQGDPIPLNRPEGFDIFAWLGGKQTGKAHGIEQVEPVTQALVKHLREEVGLKRIGAVGYCFGAKYVVRHLGIHGNIDVGYVAHPSFVEEAEFEKVKGPLSISAACKYNVFKEIDGVHNTTEALAKRINQVHSECFSSLLCATCFFNRMAFPALSVSKVPLVRATKLTPETADPDQIFPPEKRHKSEEILQKIGVPYQINLYSHVDHGFAVRGDLSKRPIKWAKEQAFYQAVQWFDEYLPA